MPATASETSFFEATVPASPSFEESADIPVLPSASFIVEIIPSATSRSELTVSTFSLTAFIDEFNVLETSFV